MVGVEQKLKEQHNKVLLDVAKHIMAGLAADRDGLDIVESGPLRQHAIRWAAKDATDLAEALIKEVESR